MNIASIDIGSNTAILLIASIEKGKLYPLYNQYETPRLGKGIDINGKITDDKIELLLKILKQFKRKIEEHNCIKTIITATNAMRLANNSEEIISKVKNDLALNIQIIPGEKEAELSFLGGSSAFPNINEKVIIDIGGGSTEIIYGNKNNILFKHSFQVGTVSLTEKFLTNFSDKLNIKEKIYNHLDSIFTLLKTNIPKGVATIAVAGTPTTLFCMSKELQEYDENIVEGAFFKYNELLNISKILVNLAPIEVKQKYGNVVNGREDVIFAGSLILLYLAELFFIDSIYISGRGLRYGSIINYINNMK